MSNGTILWDQSQEGVTKGTRAAPNNGVFYQHELVERALIQHLWDKVGNRKADLCDREFYVHVSRDGLTVTVVDE